MGVYGHVSLQIKTQTNRMFAAVPAIDLGRPLFFRLSYSTSVNFLQQPARNCNGAVPNFMLEFSQHCLFRRMYTVFRYSARNLYKCSAVAEMGDRLARIDMGRKGGLLYPFQGGAGSPSNTMWPWLRPTSVPSALLIHPAVWPQQTWAENWGGGAPF